MKVLIIDDEHNICRSLANILDDEGYSCFSIQNPKLAIDYIEETSPDVILLDVSMPGLNGLDLLEKVKEYDFSIQVIMISGHSGITEAVKAIKLGAYDFLEKPLSLPKVKIVIKKALEFRALSRENQRLKDDFSSSYQIIGESKVIQELQNAISKIAPSNSKVLIRGESGTGKELVAYQIHNQSLRCKQPFIKFNSAAIPNELVESELFGFEKGAFTGAIKSKKGKLEEADGGTLFLDEIGDMSLSAQAKILRVIQEGEFERVGSNRKEKIDARILAATHKNLEQMVKDNLFREDLYYRLNVIPIIVPPLRERKEDILLILEHFSLLYHTELNVPLKSFSAEAIEFLKKCTFPGNIRELRNLVERIYLLSEESEIQQSTLSRYIFGKGVTEKNSEDDNGIFWSETEDFSRKKKYFEKRYLSEQLLKHNYNVSQTATAINMHQSNLSRKIKELGIKLD